MHDSDDTSGPSDEPTRDLPNLEESTVVMGDRHGESGDTAAPRKQVVAIGPFSILSTLGEGGMGIVYEAEQERPRRRVALKVIRGGAFADEGQLRMFQREADTLARLKHPGIASIYQLGSTEDGQPYLVMELVRGVTLGEWVRRQPPLRSQEQLRERLEIFRQICDAVSYAHQRGVIHRDLKPGNILVTDAPDDPPTTGSGSGRIGPQVKVLDFGLARLSDDERTQLTEIGVLKGTLPYMSPEQTRGVPEEIDTRSDVYALGVILYELLTGKRPYDLEQAALVEAVRVICEDRPAPMSASWTHGFAPDDDLETIIRKALEKEPGRRYDSVSGLSDDIGRFLDSQPILARPPSAVYQLRKMVRRNRGVFALAAASLVLLVGATVVSTALYFKAERAAERERIEATKANEVAKFMVSMLEGVSPSVALGRDTTMLRDILDEAVGRIDSELAAEPEVRAKLQSHMASTYYYLSEYAPAEEVWRASHRTYLELNGIEHLDSLTSQHSLALLLFNTDRREEAEPLLKQGIEVARTDPAWDGILADQLMTYGNGLVRFGEFDAAEPLLLEAVEVSRRFAPEGSRSVGIAINSLGNLHHHRGELDQAEARYREALEVHTRVLGERHPDVLVDRHNIATLFRTRGDYGKAIELLEGILEDQHEIYGEASIDMAQVYSSLGAALNEHGKHEESKAAHETAAAMQRDLMGENSIAYSRTLNALGLTLFSMGYTEEAEASYRKAAGIQRQLIGPDSEAVMVTLGNLATLLIATERLDEGEQELNEALRIAELTVEKDSPEYLDLASSRARLYSRTERYAEAEEQMRFLLETFIANHGPDSAWAGRYRFELGMVLSRAGKHEEGERLMKESAETYAKARGEDFFAVGVVTARLADAQRKRGAFAEAERNFLTAEPFYVRNFGEDGKRTTELFEQFVKLYTEWDAAEPGRGHAEKAREWQERLEAAAS